MADIPNSSSQVKEHIAHISMPPTRFLWPWSISPSGNQCLSLLTLWHIFHCPPLVEIIGCHGFRDSLQHSTASYVFEYTRVRSWETQNRTFIWVQKICNICSELKARQGKKLTFQAPFQVFPPAKYLATAWNPAVFPWSSASPAGKWHSPAFNPHYSAT